MFLLNSDALITDSGGMQKEAYWMQKKCITIRKETEWVETLENHCNSLVYEDFESIKSMLYNKPTFKSNLYGDGDAGEYLE